MPGHKGVSFVGAEALDITEIAGADSLYEADGIIAESEANAGKLFGARTFYSTEGSSLAIRAMILLALRHARENGREPRILAGRNAHKVFLSAAALLDIDVEWIASDESNYLRCTPSAEDIKKMLSERENEFAAVYITSPDYLGNIADIEGIARVCHSYGALLLVDNAHGAYLRFLPDSHHPIELGADACADSAHKTLPALTGAAYLHVSRNAPDSIFVGARAALAMFGSTSPSYLILQSLDMVNAYVDGEYKAELEKYAAEIKKLKQDLVSCGIELLGDEPLKITVSPKSIGYEGNELAGYLRGRGMECEFSDRDVTVMMLTPQLGYKALDVIAEAMRELPKRAPVEQKPPRPRLKKRIVSVRQAMLSPYEVLPANECLGRVLAMPSVACPPAVPIVVCGELIDDEAVAAFKYYGINECAVMKDIK